MTTIRTVHWTLAVIGATIIAFFALNNWAADAAGDAGAASAYRPITPCRAADTRAATNIGPHVGSLGPADELTLDVNNAPCNLPAATTAVTINLTGIGHTSDTFLSVRPADVPDTGTSTVNLVAGGQYALPNEVTVQVSIDGEITIRNEFGHTHVAVDVLGYFEPTPVADGGVPQDVLDRLDTLEQQVTTLQDENLALRLAALEDEALPERLGAVEDVTSSMAATTVDGYPTVRFEGVNVQVVDGSGTTDGDTNGLGNLIVGYHEDDLMIDSDLRSGSHNLVVGADHGYTGYGSLIAGFDNETAGAYATVTGGRHNEATGNYSSVGGGQRNKATGGVSAVTGGQDNWAEGGVSSITGGSENRTVGSVASVSGGGLNIAHAAFSSITGGKENTTGAEGNSIVAKTSTITGGQGNTTDTDYQNLP